MRNIYRVKTPENVTLEFELAGIGSRGVAVVLDTVFQYLIIFLVVLLAFPAAGDGIFDMTNMKENTAYIVIALLLIFIVQFGYFLLFEFFMKGSTPGKKIVGLKVMMANGEPLTFTAALVRNLLRIGDMLPGIYGVGILSVFLNKRYMRVGDLAANTVVVKDKREKHDFPGIRETNAGRPDIHISPREEALLIEYGERIRDRKNPLNSAVLENQLYHHFYGKIGALPNLPEKYDRKTYLRCLLDCVGVSRA